MNNKKFSLKNTLNYTSDKAFAIVNAGFFTLVTIIVIFLFVGQTLLPDERDTYYSFNTLNTGWEKVLDNGDTIPVTLPYKVLEEPGKLTVYQTTLPEQLGNISTICIRSLWQDVDIYVDGELRNHYDTKDSRLWGENSPIRYLFVTLTPSDAQKVVRVELTTTIKDYSGYFYDVYVGDETGIWLHLIKESGTRSILEFTLLVLSIITLFICALLKILYKRRLDLTYLGWGTFFTSLWLFSELRFRQIFFPNISTLSNITFFALMLIPFPFLSYINKIQNGRYKIFHATAVMYATVITLLLTAFQIFNIADFRNSVFHAHIALGVSILSLLGSIVADIITKHIKEYTFVAIGFLGIVVCASLEMAIFYINNSNTLGSSISIGLIFLLCMATLKTGRDYLASERDRQHAVSANEAKAQFLAHMSHEIRTPINTIIGMSEMILRENEDDGISEYANNVHSSSRMLLALINDILDFSKIESGQLSLVEASYQFASLIVDEFNLLENRAANKKLQLNLDVDSKLPSVMHGDEIRIKQIVTNLLTNAVKYTDSGSITLKAFSKPSENDSIILCFDVSDTGAGIKQENMNRLFESFIRFDETKNRGIEGTGLGLAITSQLVHLMNGTISVTSEYQKGSTFHVEIPQKIIDPTPIGNIYTSHYDYLSRNKIQKETFTAPNARVLIVDDNEMNLAVVKALLKRTLIKCELVNSGFKAIEKTKQEKYDIIFMDHMMPELDGIETLKLIKSAPDNLNINTPIIALTANAIVGCDEMYLGCGFTDYLSKPIEAAKLEDTLIKHLPKKLVKLSYKPLNELNISRPTDEINRKKGLNYCGNSEELYKTVIRAYCNQSLEYREQLTDCFNKKDMHNYSIVMHALKSNSHNIGAENFAAEALEHETAAKEGNTDFVLKNFNSLIENLDSLLNVIKKML